MSQKNKVLENVIINHITNGDALNQTVYAQIARFITADAKKYKIKIDDLYHLTALLKQLNFTVEMIKEALGDYSQEAYTKITGTATNWDKILSTITPVYDKLTEYGYMYFEKKNNPFTCDALKRFIQCFWGEQIKTDIITGKTSFPMLNVNENAKFMYIVDTAVKHLHNVYCGATVDMIKNMLRVLIVSNTYNPVQEMLENVKWDGKDRLPIVYKYLQQDDPFKQMLIRKWLIQCVALMFNDGTIGAQGCLTLYGPQGTGKTAFFQNIVPNQSWMSSVSSFDPSDKDKLRQATTPWIVELAEVEDMYKRPQGALKNFITSTKDEYRLPYDVEIKTYERHASMGATVNKIDFIADDNARRWWVIEMNNYNTVEQIIELNENAEQIWAQVYQIYKLNPNGFRLTSDERQAIMQKNNDEYHKCDFWETQILQRYDIQQSIRLQKQGTQKTFPSDAFQIFVNLEQVSGKDTNARSQFYKAFNKIMKSHPKLQTYKHGGRTGYYLIERNQKNNNDEQVF